VVKVFYFSSLTRPSGGLRRRVVYLPPGLVPPRVVVVGDVVVDPLGGRGLLRRGRLVEGVVALVVLAGGLGRGRGLASRLDVVLAAVGLLLDCGGKNKIRKTNVSFKLSPIFCWIQSTYRLLNV
jgi:hypothetical protein